MPRSAVPPRHPRIGPHHFAFLRAYLQGMELRSAGDRYLEPDQDLRRLKATLKWLREEFIVAARRQRQFADARALGIDVRELPPPTLNGEVPTLEAFRAMVDPEGDFYPEKELIAQYRERYPTPSSKSSAQRRVEHVRRLRARQLRAVVAVEPLLVTNPSADDPPSAWLPDGLALKLERMKIRSLGATVEIINRFGHRWWTRIPKLGPVGAQKIVGWLERHAPALGLTVQRRALIPHAQMARAIAERPVTRVCAVVPLERFVAPGGLSGEQGTNRGVRNRLDAENDWAAIQAWLAAKATNPHTFRAYRKEAERLLLWAVVKRGKAMSSLSVEDCVAYRDFLRNPMPTEEWVGPRNAARFSGDWRPFEGALSVSSVKNALVVLKSLFEWLSRARYLDSNPFDGVPVLKASPQSDEDDSLHEVSADRYLPVKVWGRVRAYVDRLPDDEASARLRFVLLFAYTTGLRASELVMASVGRLRRAPWSEDEERFTLSVLGKGGRVRVVPFVPAVMGLLQDYLRHRGLPIDLGQCDPKARLITPLGHYAERHVDAEPVMTTSGLYRVVTGVLSEVADELQRSGAATDANQLRQASTHWLRHTFGTHALQKGASLQNVRGLLGHQSIATTSIYAHGDEEGAYGEVEKLPGLH